MCFITQTEMCKVTSVEYMMCTCNCSELSEFVVCNDVIITGL